MKGEARAPLARFCLLALALGLPGAGCAAVSNPVWDAVPVRQLPPEVLGESKEAMRPVALNLLRQPPPAVYRVDAGDVLGVWIEGVLGERNMAPPVRISEQGNAPPAFGYPLPVRDDGTLPVPLVEPVRVR